MISKILKDAVIVPKTVGYKITKRLLTIEDEEEACAKPEWAYKFAKNVPGADIEKCCEAACKNPMCAYLFALDIPGANIEKCQEAACKDPKYAYWFAWDVPGANVEKCREAACHDVFWAYKFTERLKHIYKGSVYVF
jgi:hypothetical protein